MNRLWAIIHFLYSMETIVWIIGILKFLIGYAFDKVIPGLVGTGVGAWLAFRINNKRDEAELRRARIECGWYALHCIDARISFLKSLEKLFCGWRDPSKTRTRWIEMRPQWILSLLPDVQLTTLSFLMMGKGASLYGEITSAINKSNTVAQILKIRNEQHAEAMLLVDNNWRDPKYQVEIQKIFGGSQPSAKDLATMWLPQYQRENLHTVTEALLEHLPIALNKCRTSLLYLDAQLKAAYPDVPFLSSEVTSKIQCAVDQYSQGLNLCPSNTPSTASTRV